MMKFNTLIELIEVFPEEQAAIDHFRSIRWADGAFCPHCGSTRVYHFKDNRTHKCGDCRQRFSIKVGTIFEDSKIPLRKWFMAIWMATIHKKGISSVQLAKDIGVTQKTAWFMMHRLRHAARTKSFNRPLDGEIELDETFLGGSENNKHAHKRSKNRGRDTKTVLFGMLERGGDLRPMKIEILKSRMINAVVFQHVKLGANVMMDEFRGYDDLREYYHRYSVNHFAGQHVKHYFAHVNNLEGAWSHFKRQVKGILFWVSVKHVDRYLDEFTWRWNRRNMDEGPRIDALLRQSTGRLRYRELTA